MMDEKTRYEYLSRSEAETRVWARSLGAALPGGTVIELRSDVGGGKTTFTKGLAEGLGVHETVQSPTFTINRLYDGRDGLRLSHYDFYRLSDAGIMQAELAETLADPSAVTVIEWADTVTDVLPPGRTRITIEQLGEQERRFIVEQGVPA